MTRNISSRGLTELNAISRREKRRQDREIKALKSRNFETSIASAGLSSVELRDIERLDARRNKSKGTLKFKKKRSGLNVVALKRLEEQRASRTSGLVFSSRIRGKQGRAKLFANPNFDLGLSSSATQKDRDFMIAQRNAHRGQQAKARANRIRQQQRERTGASIRSNLGINRLNQKRKLRKLGIALHGGNLSNKTLAILRARGLI